jgi:PAS domain S-box-containing protein
MNCLGGSKDTMATTTTTLASGAWSDAAEAGHESPARRYEMESKPSTRDIDYSAEPLKKDSISYFVSLIDVLPDAIFLVDAAGCIVAANHRATELFTYRPGELTGKSIEVLVPAPHAERHVILRKNFAKNAAARAMGFNRPTLLGQRKDGSTVPVDIALSPTVMSGQPITIVVVRDMSERIAMAEQLRRAQKLDALGNLSSGIAHDFNNVLAIIRTILETVRLKLDAHNPINEAITRAIGATKVGAELTQRLLAFARKQTLAPKVINTRAFVADAVDLMKHTLGGHVQIQEDYDDNVWNCCVDPAQFENAIVNLSINARDAMPKGGKLTYRLRNISYDDSVVAALTGLKAGRYISFEVDDTGTGLRPEVAQRAFEPFFSTKSPGKGTGLGLSMIYGFAVQSAGTARLRNKPSGGTIAQIILPACEQEIDAAPASLPATDSSTSQIAQAKQRTVLVVDDNADLRGAVCAMLSEVGLVAVAVDGIDDAMAALKSRPGIDILLTDLALADGHSGYDLILRARRERPDLHFIVMSGFAEGHSVPPEIDNRFLILRKPFDLKELAHAILTAED